METETKIIHEEQDSLYVHHRTESTVKRAEFVSDGVIYIYIYIYI